MIKINVHGKFPRSVTLDKWLCRSLVHGVDSLLHVPKCMSKDMSYLPVHVVQSDRWVPNTHCDCYITTRQHIALKGQFIM